MTVDRSYEEEEQFPVGMRVLAVDDDPTCLKLLETLLRKCRYHVTTTSQAIIALKLLRENKNKFDLVISDVHMPDMDGFKLLELVGLEMDLPVIMLSGNGDTKLVMKGITHGACDYLLKPVRMEELKNIWQHVVRKKKVHPKSKNNPDKLHNENESGQALPLTNCKLNRKRKDQKEEDDEDRENELTNEESSAQKKARLVWTGDLHRKFVAAVRTLGVDNAVPKKILETMNVENLTRENVASHLQKYRKYLNRISCVASQQANMVAALGGPDAAYMRMTSLSGHGNLQNPAVRPFSSTGLLGSRLNTPSGLPMPAPPASGTIQLAHTQNLNNPINIKPKFQPVMMPRNQNGNFHGMPTSLEQLQLDNGVGNYVEPLSGNVNQICGTVPLSSTEFLSDLQDFGRCTDSWSACQPNPFTSSESIKRTIPGDYGNMFPSPVNSFTLPLVNGTSDIKADFIQKLRSEENNFSAYQNPNLVCNSMNSSISSHEVLGSLTQYNDNFENKNSGFSRSDDLNMAEILFPSDQQIIQQNENERSALQTADKMKQGGYLMDQPNPLDGYSDHNGGSFEDLVSMMRKLDQDMFM